jgi:hypothetical protein
MDNLTLLAYQGRHTGYYTQLPEQSSAPVALEAGVRYPLHVVHMEGTEVTLWEVVTFRTIAFTIQ